MRKTLTEAEVAQWFGIHPVTVPTLAGLRPLAPSEVASAKRLERGAPAKQGDRGPWEVTRRELAEMLDVHPDSVSRWIPEGLGAAVIDRQAKGELVFDLRIAWRWWLAKHGLLNQLVLDDFKACSSAGVVAVHAWSALPFVEALLDGARRSEAAGRAKNSTRRNRALSRRG